MPADHFLDTPYLPKEYDRLPKHERIIDPWGNIKDIQKGYCLVLQLYNAIDYEEIGPELIIFYLGNPKKKKSDYLILPAKRLASHKKNYNYPNAVAFPILNESDLVGEDNTEED